MLACAFRMEMRAVRRRPGAEFTLIPGNHAPAGGTAALFPDAALKHPRSFQVATAAPASSRLSRIISRTSEAQRPIAIKRPVAISLFPASFC